MEFIRKMDMEEARNDEEELLDKDELLHETPLERVARMVDEGEVRFDWGD